VAWAPDGEYLAASFRTDGPSHLLHGYGNLAWFRARSRVPGKSLAIRPEDSWLAHKFDVRAISFSPSGKQLATAGKDVSDSSIKAKSISCIKIWNLAKHEIEARSEFDYFTVHDVCFCPDGKELAAISHDPGIELRAWDLEKISNGELRKPHLGKRLNDRGNALAYSPDGITVVAGFESGRLVWWQPGEKEIGIVRHAHKGAVKAVAFSPDGRTVLSAGADGLVKIWDAQTRALLTTFDWQLGDISCVAVAPDGLTAAVGGNGPILLWDLEG
jgi:WD40 repeat protein